MMRTIVVAICASLMTLTAHGEDGPGKAAKTALEGGVRIPANIGFSTNVSPDRQALTILFDNVSQEVARTQKGEAGTLGQTLSATRVVTLEVPYSTDQRSVKMAMDLRGFATRTPTPA